MPDDESKQLFEHDPVKSVSNARKHGIDFETAQQLWDGRPTVTGPSWSNGEERWMIVGSIGEKLWSAIVTYREGRIRIISVRRARPKEAARYEARSD